MQLTVMGMKSSEEKVALQAIEFWSTVCEEESELFLEAAEVYLTHCVINGQI
jgi:importin subunit beta-1